MYYFSGEAQEAGNHYGVWVGCDGSQEGVEVQFHRDGTISCNQESLFSKDRDSIIAAASHPQVLEQVALFMANQPCYDLTMMP